MPAIGGLRCSSPAKYTWPLCRSTKGTWLLQAGAARAKIDVPGHDTSRYAWSAEASRQPAAFGVPPSLRLDVRRLDDRPPFLDFGLVISKQRLGGQLLARENILRDIGEALTHDRIGERIHDGLVELGDGVFRRALGD